MSCDTSDYVHWETQDIRNWETDVIVVILLLSVTPQCVCHHTDHIHLTRSKENVQFTHNT